MSRAGIACSDRPQSAQTAARLPARAGLGSGARRILPVPRIGGRSVGFRAIHVR